MDFKHSESETRVPRGIINLQDRCSSSITDVRARKMTTNNPLARPPTTRVEKRKLEYNRSLSQGNARRLLTASHFSLVSLLLLLCLTASLLILPLVLPPLPPPPFMLLLLPIGRCLLLLQVNQLVGIPALLVSLLLSILNYISAMSIMICKLLGD